MQLVQKYRVLVLCEATCLANGFATFLRKNNGLAVDGVTTIDAVRHRLTNESYDVAVLRLGANAQDVLKFVASLREETARPAIILITEREGEFVQELVERQMADVVHAVFQRPFEITELAASIAGLTTDSLKTATATS